jgi:predicted nucleic acid-binding protein
LKLVLDASAALSWMLEDERDDTAVAMAAAVLTHGANVPPLFKSEVHNVLAVAVKRKRTTLAKAAEVLAALARLPLCFETKGVELESIRVVETAYRCGISAYDATYLALAQKLEAKLMTRDRRVRSAAASLDLLWEFTFVT